MSDTDTFVSLTAVVVSLGPARSAPRRTTGRPWPRVVLTDLSEVEELLDLLEARGFADRQVVVDGEMFVVRWR